MLCYEFIENNSSESFYDDCNMYVKAEALPHHMTFMKVKSKAEAATKETTVENDNTISTSTSSLQYKGQSDAGAAMFSFTGADGQSHDFEFNLQYYNPSEGESPNKSGAISGAYLFTPEVEDQDAHLYSDFSSIEVHQGTLASEFRIYYEST